MADAQDERIDSASRVIKSSAERLYRALVDPESLVAWLPPDGMKGEIQEYDARPGGRYRMVLIYEGAEHTPGKSSENSDVVQGRFLELVPSMRLVQSVVFETPDPAFAGAMKMTWALFPVAGGTDVTITCENVPPGISKEDHATGMSSSLENLAAFVE